MLQEILDLRSQLRAIRSSPSWRLTGPITAMNGILMFGWSTAVLFEVLRKTLDHLAAIEAEGISPADPG